MGELSAISVFIVEDDWALATAWSRYLEMMGLRIGTARSLKDAGPHLQAERWQEAPFDVVLLDLNLPDGDGRTLIPVLELLRPAPRVAVLTGHLSSALAVELAGVSVMGIPKPIESRTLLRLIQLLGDIGNGGEAFRALHEQYRLSPKERRLVELAAAGTDNNEAARLLDCKRGTVTTYWRRIFRKTGLGSQREVLGLFIGHALRASRALFDPAGDGVAAAGGER